MQDNRFLDHEVPYVKNRERDECDKILMKKPKSEFVKMVEVVEVVEVVEMVEVVEVFRYNDGIYREFSAFLSFL